MLFVARKKQLVKIPPRAGHIEITHSSFKQCLCNRPYCRTSKEHPFFVLVINSEFSPCLTQELKLHNLTTGVKCTTLRTWTRVPMTQLVRARLAD